MLFKGATLTLLSINTPNKEAISIYKEIRIRNFLDPIVPTVTHVHAADARPGFDTYLARHSVDLLIVIPNDKDRAGSLTDTSETQSGTYTLPVPLLTIYNDGSNDLPQRINALAHAGYTF